MDIKEPLKSLNVLAPRLNEYKYIFSSLSSLYSKMSCIIIKADKIGLTDYGTV